MSNAVQQINKMKAGACPHGLPSGACPICSCSAGSMKQSDKNRKIGEMTYHECAMIGNMLRARALVQKNNEINMKHRAEALQEFEQHMAKMSAKMIAFAEQIAKNFMLKPLAFVIQNIAVPVLNIIRNIPVSISNFIEKLAQFKQKIFDIMDKLTAVFGEIKNFIQKKISEFISAVKSKLSNLFRIFKRKNAEDDDTKIDDDKKMFNLKTILNKIQNKLKEKKDKKNDSSKN